MSGRSEVLIRADHVHKKLCRDLRRSLWYGLIDLKRELVPVRGPADRHGLRKEEFWAVDDVSFELRRGECIGLIGRNGAGKTTLLKLLNGLIKPTRGEIEIRGRVGALIALGAGFNPILTGRENVYVNAAVLGLRKREVSRRIAEIIEFSELEEFIDAPVQSYSSGMMVRLGFSIAAVLIRPDVLFLDEVLAVGDIGFTIKCLNTIKRMAEQASVVFVSHNMQLISMFSSRVMVLDKGRIAIDSHEPGEGIDQYFAMVQHEVQVSGTGQARVSNLGLIVNNHSLTDPEPQIHQGTECQAQLDLEVEPACRAAHLQLAIHDQAMAPVVCVPLHSNSGQMREFPPGKHCLRITLGACDLNAGKYSFVVSVLDADTHLSLARVQGLCPFRVFSERTHWGRVVRPSIAEILTAHGAPHE